MSKSPDRRLRWEGEAARSPPLRAALGGHVSCLQRQAWRWSNQSPLPTHSPALLISQANGLCRTPSREPMFCEGWSAKARDDVLHAPAADSERGHKAEPNIHNPRRQKRSEKHRAQQDQVHPRPRNQDRPWSQCSQALCLGFSQFDDLLHPFQFQRRSVHSEAIAPTAQRLQR